MKENDKTGVIPNAQIQQILFLLLIAALLGLVFWNLSGFMPALLGAYTLYILLKRPMRYLSERRKWNPKLSAGILMLVSFVVILLPLNALFLMLSSKLTQNFQNSQQISQYFDSAILTVENRIGLHILTPERIQNISEWGVQELRGIVNATFLGLLQVSIAYFVLWFLLTEGKTMEATFFNWLPLRNENIEFVRKELNSLVLSNAVGIPLMGLVQALAGMLGYWAVGVDDLLLWVFITFIAGMIPFLGVMLAYLPLAFVLFSKGMTNQGIFILIYGTVVIGTVDNVARMWLLKKIGHTHPLITLFGVIIGLKLFGFIGFIFGPILISMFLLLLKIYVKEFNEQAQPQKNP